MANASNHCKCHANKFKLAISPPPASLSLFLSLQPLQHNLISKAKRIVE